MTGAPTAFPPLVVGSDPVRTERATRPAFVMTLVCAGLIPRAFARLAKLGFQVGEVAIDTPLDTLLAASGAFTGGRLR
jgi:hypothetical protein